MSNASRRSILNSTRDARTNQICCLHSVAFGVWAIFFTVQKYICCTRCRCRASHKMLSLSCCTQFSISTFHMQFMHCSEKRAGLLTLTHSVRSQRGWYPHVSSRIWKIKKWIYIFGFRQWPMLGLRSCQRFASHTCEHIWYSNESNCAWQSRKKPYRWVERKWKQSTCLRGAAHTHQNKNIIISRQANRAIKIARTTNERMSVFVLLFAHN